MSNVSDRLVLNDTVSVAYKPLSPARERSGQPIKLGWWESLFWRPIKAIDGSTVLVNINSVRKRLELSTKEDAKDLLAGGHQGFLKAMARRNEKIFGLSVRDRERMGVQRSALGEQLLQIAKNANSSQNTETAGIQLSGHKFVFVVREGGKQIFLEAEPKEGVRSVRRFDLVEGTDVSTYVGSALSTDTSPQTLGASTSELTSGNLSPSGSALSTDTSPQTLGASTSGSASADLRFPSVPASSTDVPPQTSSASTSELTSGNLSPSGSASADSHVQALDTDQFSWLKTEEKAQFVSFFQSGEFKGAIASGETRLFQRRERDGMPRSVYVVRGEAYVLRNRVKEGDRLVGEGTFTKIKTAQHVLTGHTVAYGSTRPDPSNTKEMEIANELPPTVSNQPVAESVMIKTHKSGGERSIRLEPLLGGDLIHMLSHPKFASSKEQPKFWIGLFTDMARVLKEMHESGYLHRDVKLQNYLFGWPDGEEKPDIKMGDMGFAVKKGEVGERDTPCTPTYASPEFIQQSYTINGDMRAVTTEQHDGWALGVCLLMLLKAYNKLNIDLNTNPLLAELLLSAYISQEAVLYNRLAMAMEKRGQQLFQKPEDENSLEFVIWKLLQLDPKDRWTPAQAYEALSRMQVTVEDGSN